MKATLEQLEVIEKAKKSTTFKEAQEILKQFMGKKGGYIEHTNEFIGFALNVAPHLPGSGLKWSKEKNMWIDDV